MIGRFVSIPILPTFTISLCLVYFCFNIVGPYRRDSVSLLRFPYYYYYYYYFSFESFFTSALADGFSLEFECQQVSSSLQDSSQYSDRSQ